MAEFTGCIRHPDFVNAAGLLLADLPSPEEEEGGGVTRTDCSPL
jgi:hypothetical protein